MKRCGKCGYFVNATQGLGGCYCGNSPNRAFHNIHDIEMFQALGVAFTGSTVGPCLCYADGFPNAPGETHSQLTLSEWITKFNNKGRNVYILYSNGHTKTLPIEKFMNILRHDGHCTDDEVISV